jgi:hypothetical protein
MPYLLEKVAGFLLTIIVVVPLLLAFIISYFSGSIKKNDETEKQKEA